MATAVGIHENFAGPQKTDPRGHPLDRPAGRVGMAPGRQGEEAGTEGHQHMHPHPPGVAVAGMETIDAHGIAAQHGEAKPQQLFGLLGNRQDGRTRGRPCWPDGGRP